MEGNIRQGRERAYIREEQMEVEEDAQSAG